MPPILPRAAGAFFALVDDCEGSERRLDELALPLTDDLRELERRAAEIISNKRDDVTKAHDYLSRLAGYNEKLAVAKVAGIGDNKSPPLLEGSAASPPSSGDAPPSPPSSPTPATQSSGDLPAAIDPPAASVNPPASVTSWPP